MNNTHTQNNLVLMSKHNSGNSVGLLNQKYVNLKIPNSYYIIF